MLVLTRRVGQDIFVGPVCVHIVAIEGRTVRLGISAPPSVRVDRLEVHLRHSADPSLPDLAREPASLVEGLDEPIRLTS